MSEREREREKKRKKKKTVNFIQNIRKYEIYVNQRIVHHLLRRATTTTLFPFPNKRRMQCIPNRFASSVFIRARARERERERKGEKALLHFQQ